MNSSSAPPTDDNFVMSLCDLELDSSVGSAEAIARLCIGFIDAHWPEVVHFATRTVPDESLLRGVAPFRLRCLAEISILLEASGYTKLHRRLRNGVASRFIRLVRQQELLTAPSRREAVLPTAQIANSIFEISGDRSAKQFASAILDSRQLLGESRPVLNAAVRFMRAKLQGGQSFAYGDLLQQSILGQRAPAELLSRGDWYDLTHWIYYLSDFGRQSIPHEIHTDVAPWLAREIAIGSAAQHDQGDSDLLIELLAADHILHQSLRQWALPYWRLLLDEASRGIFRVPTFSPQLLRQFCGTERDRYLFRNQYHSFVAYAVAGRARHAASV